MGRGSPGWEASCNAEAGWGEEAGQGGGWVFPAHSEYGLVVMAALFWPPSFPADEFNILRQRLVVGLRLRRSNATNLVDDIIDQMIYGSHPAANPVPAPEALAGLKSEMTTAWYRGRYAPASTVVSVAGRLRPAD